MRYAYPPYGHLNFATIGISILSPELAIEALERIRFDVILTDLRMEKVDGMAVFRRAKELDPETAVVLITGFATLDSAVEAMKAGAFHYITISPSLFAWVRFGKSCEMRSN